MKGKKGGIWSVNFTVLFITSCVMYFGQYMMTTLLPKYLCELGVKSSVIGVIVGLFSVTALVTRPLTGTLIEGCDKKKLYIAMLGVLAAASFGYAFVSSVPFLVFFRLLHGAGMGCSAALGLVLASDELPEDKLASGLGIYGLSSVLATAFGSGAGLAVAGRFGYTAAFCFSGALVSASLLIAGKMRLEKEPGKRPIFRLSNVIAKEALLPACFLMLCTIARAGIITYLVIYITEERQIGGITLYYIINAAALLISRPLIGALSDKAGIHRALIPTYISFAAGLILLAYCKSTWQLCVTAVLNAFGTGAAQTTHQALCMKVVSPTRRGAGSTTACIGTDLGELLGPVICGFLVEHLGYANMYLLSLVPLALCALSLWFWVQKNGGTPQPQ